MVRKKNSDTEEQKELDIELPEDKEVPLDETNTGSGLVDAPENPEAQGDAAITAGVPPIETTMCSLNLEAYIRAMFVPGENPKPFFPQMSDAGDVLFITLDKEKRVEKIFTVIGDHVKNITKIAV